MSSGRPRHVSLTGDLSGDYVVLEERSDGSLVVAPDTARRSGGRPPQPASRSGLGLLSGLLARQAPTPARASVPEILESWGLELGEDELVEDFLLGDIDGQTGFIALTNQRFIFAATEGRKHSVIEEHLLSAARNVQLVGRPRKQRLRVSFHGSEYVIWVPDRDAFARLHRRLAGDDDA